MPGPGRATHRLAWLDYLRFLAALAVVGFHWLYLYGGTGKIKTLQHTPLAPVASYGYLGVHLFFLISGFVISNSAQGKTPAQFAVGRAVRLYPAFWAAVTVTSTVWLLAGTSEAGPTAVQYVVNLTMVPSPLGQPLIDPSYWTLLHELVFYAFVGMLLLTGGGRHLDSIVTGWSFVLLALAIAAPSTRYMLLGGALYAFFAGGAILSAINRRGWNWWRAGGLAASYATSMLYVVRTTGDRGAEAHTSYSIALTAAIVTVFYVAIAAQTRPRVRAINLPGSSQAAGLTYPVYLVHHAIGFAMLYRFSSPDNGWWLYPLTFMLMLGVAQTVHILVERRLAFAWRALFGLVLGRPLEALSSATSKRPRRQREPAGSSS